MTTLSTTIRSAREARGLTQVELARRAVVGQPFLSMVETGRKTPSLATYTRLIAALGLDPGSGLQ